MTDFDLVAAQRLCDEETPSSESATDWAYKMAELLPDALDEIHRLRDDAKRVRAEALREAAADLYSDDGPGNLLSTATWLRARADAEEGK